MTLGSLHGRLDEQPFAIPIGPQGSIVLGWETLICNGTSGISEYHVQVRVHQQQLTIRDLNSSAGTELRFASGYQVVKEAGPLNLPFQLRLGGRVVSLDRLEVVDTLSAPRSTRHVRATGAIHLRLQTDSRGLGLRLEAVGPEATGSFTVARPIEGAILATLLRAHAGAGFVETSLVETIQWAPLEQKDGTPLSRADAPRIWKLPESVASPLVPPHPPELLRVDLAWRKLRDRMREQVGIVQARLETALTTAARVPAGVVIADMPGHHRYKLTTSVRVASVVIEGIR